MFDIIVLIIIPVAIGICVSLFSAYKSNILFKNKQETDKAYVVSHQSTIIHDKNHKKSRLDILMQCEKDETFLKNCAYLLKNNVSNIVIDRGENDE